MPETENADTKSDSSPPAIPPLLAEELARIIARALVADYRADLLKTFAIPATANAGIRTLRPRISRSLDISLEINQCLKPIR